MTAYSASKLIQCIDRDRLVTLLRDLVAIPSVNPFDQPVSEEARELEIANFYEEKMQEIGMLTSRRDVVEGRPNVFGRIKGKGDGPCIMMAGHLDTVGVVDYDNPFDPKIKNDRVYGRGSCDMKAGLAVFLEVAGILSREGIELEGDLLIAGIADEEHQMIGSREIRANGPIPDFAIVGEPTELEVSRAHKGQLCMHIHTHGKACHSSIPENGVNAIQHMSKILEALGDYNEELRARPAHPTFGHGSFSPGVIKGGDIASSVPDSCTLEVDRRLLSGESVQQVVSEYRKRVDPLAAKIDNFHYEISEPTLYAEPLDTSADSPIVQKITAAYLDTLQVASKLPVFTGSTDAPNLMAPAVICGPGSVKQAHTLDEYVEIPQLTQAAAIYLRTILAMQHSG
ncbi:MAG: M20 family metallopeptidase [Acidiferrobacterales bacterium]|nr:M20 family metallopeptidase [Acidiferrobacterales bacterium]